MTKIRFVFLLFFCGAIATGAGYFVFLNSTVFNLHLLFFRVPNIRIGAALIIFSVIGVMLGVMLAAALISVLMMKLRVAKRRISTMQSELDTYRLQGVKESS